MQRKIRLQRPSEGAAGRFRHPIGVLVCWIGAGLALGATASRAQSLEDALRRLQADDVLVADAAVEEVAGFGAEGAEALLPFLDDSRRNVRAGAIRGLGLLGERRAAEPLRGLLRASLDNPEPDTMEDRYFRVLAIQALGRIRDPQAAGLLREVTERGDEFERAHAGISLFLLDEDPGYDVVRECLADTAMAIRNLAVEGLGDSKSEQAREFVLSMTNDRSWVVRDTVYRVLGRWSPDGEIREALRRGADDPSWFVRQTADEARRARGNEKGER